MRHSGRVVTKLEDEVVVGEEFVAATDSTAICGGQLEQEICVSQNRIGRKEGDDEGAFAINMTWSLMISSTSASVSSEGSSVSPATYITC